MAQPNYLLDPSQLDMPNPAGGNWFDQWNQPGNDGVDYGGVTFQSPQTTAPVQSGGSPQDAQAWFQQRFPAGSYLSPDMLKAAEAELNAHGITLAPNAEGVVGKVKFPDGRIGDVIEGAGSGTNKAQLLFGDGGSSGGGGSLSGLSAGAFTSPYSTPFSLPSQADLQNMPGYQSGMDAYLKGVQNSAAAKGTLLTGGTVQRVGQAASDYANQQYGNLAGLSLGVQDREFNRFQRNQDAPFDKYYKLSDLGLRAATA